MNRISVLMGRMDKLANLQSKLLGLKGCRVLGGDLPEDIVTKIKTPEFQKKIQDKIDRAEMMRLRIAILIYEDIQK